MQSNTQRLIDSHGLSGIVLRGFVLSALCWSCQTPASPPPAPAAEENVKPGINDSFLAEDLDPLRFKGIFEVESREIFAQRDEILSALQLEAGEEVADLGTGTGLFLEGLCKGVGQEGLVYAVDISQGMLDFVGERVIKEQLAPVQVVLCEVE